MINNDGPIYSMLDNKGNGTWGQGGPPAGTTAWSCSAGWAMASWNCPYDWSLGPFPSPEPSIDCTYELEVAHVGEYYFIPCYQS